MSRVIVLVLTVCSQVYSYHLPLPENARSSGTGGAFVACSGQAESLYYNPAAFYNIKNTLLEMDYNQYLTGLNSESALTPDDGYYAVNIYSLGLGLVSPIGSQSAIGIYYHSFSYHELNTIQVLGLAFSSEISGLLNMEPQGSLGIALKYLHNEYGENVYNRSFFKSYSSKITGFAMDLGLFFNVLEDLDAGLCILNLVSTDIGILGEDSIERLIKAGIKYSIKKSLGMKEIALLFDFTYLKNDYDLSFGLEMRPVDKFSIRTGINFTYLAFGARYEVSRFSINYALNYMLSGFEQAALNHKAGFGIKF